MLKWKLTFRQEWRLRGRVARIILKRTLNGFVCLEDEMIPDGWRVGEDLICDVKRSRSVPLHKKAFALLNLVRKHTDYPSLDALRKAMTVGAGFVDPIVNPITGEVALSPRSWAFEGMDDLEFAELFSRLIDVALKLVPNSTRDDWESVEQEISRW
jgi:hypothetical protein